MGMDLYNSSPAARAVWEGADAHLLAVYGFPIIEIVMDNLKEKTIHFGGIKGQAIRQRYMDMTYDRMDKDGHVKTLPLFADIKAFLSPMMTAVGKELPDSLYSQLLKQVNPTSPGSEEAICDQNLTFHAFGEAVDHALKHHKALYTKEIAEIFHCLLYLSFLMRPQLQFVK